MNKRGNGAAHPKRVERYVTTLGESKEDDATRMMVRRFITKRGEKATT